ncbi:phage tail tape measure protein [Paenibacillus eucommiae]|uniref:Phage-related minor tail protein n=1 Tax=Paenibacillus eucommiae TaxID=1355755 RepID=A0ABS4IZX8_9BACL|nr:phage tail tape measure protein [Paenibacillus eucommiae]MBP1992551.1 phage-related minor tail protein [Paenibacillus eucommiae]
MEIFRLFGSILVESGEAENSLSNIGKAAGAATLALGAVAIAAAAAIGTKAVQVADEFKKAMNGLAAETGSTTEEMDEYAAATKRLYNANLGENFEDIAKAMAKVNQTTGESGEELENLTKNALMLRDTFEMDVEGSINTVNSLIQNFGISGEQAYTLIAQGAQMGANKNGDLLDVMNEYAPHFAQLGLNANEFTDTLIQGAAAGAFQIDKMGDAVKEFGIRSKDESKLSAEAYAALGLNAEEMFATFAAGGPKAGDAFQLVIEKLGGMEDPLAQNQAGVALFGTMFEDLGVEAIKALGDIDDNADMTRDTLQKMGEIKYDSFTQGIQSIGRQFETGVLIPIGEKIIPKLEELATWFEGKMPQIEGAIKKSMDVAIGLFDGLAKAVMFVTDNMNIFLPVLLGVTAAIAAQAIINTVTALYGAWKTATTTMTTSQWLLNAAMSANPIGLVALAIGALIAAGIALYMNWDKVSAFLSASWEWIKETAVNVFNWLVDFFIEWGPLILAALTGPVGILVYAIVKYWDEIKEFTVNIWNSIMKFFTTDVPAAFNKVVGFFSELPGKIQTFLHDLFFVKIPYAVGYAIGWMIKAFSEGIPKVIKFFEELPGKVWTWLVKLYTDFDTWRKDMVSKAIEIGTNVLKSIVDFFAELPGKVWDWLVSTVNKLIEWRTNAATKAKEAGKAILDSIIEFVKKLPTDISIWFTNAVTTVKGFGTTALEAAGTVGKNIVNGIVDFIKGIPAKIDEFVGGIAGKITTIAGNIKGAISSIFKSGKEGIEAGAVTAGGSATITVPAHASGTNFAPGGLSLVGEEGPELVNLPRGSQVYPNDRTEQLLGGGSSIIIQTMYVRNDQDINRVSQELERLRLQRLREAGIR